MNAYLKKLFVLWLVVMMWGCGGSDVVMSEDQGDTDNESGAIGENNESYPSTPCNPNPCTQSNRSVCIAGEGSNFWCQCDAGYVEYPDGECRLQDPCASDAACANQHRSCENDNGVAKCGDCVAGYHDEAGDCIQDGVCGPNTCSGHGECTESDGAVSCSCEEGYLGDHCENCDETGGWHRAGDGVTCTQDPCDPDPCTDDESLVCVNGDCICPDTHCEIDNKCLEEGENHPEYLCQWCKPSISRTEWSLKPADTLCRPGTTPCDKPEVCDGANADCPANRFESAGVPCREAAGVCDAVEYCTGNSATCPEDGKLKLPCRPAVNLCDVAEVCDGISDTCPEDVLQPDQTSCDDANPCTKNDSCIGGICQGVIRVECDDIPPCHESGACVSSTGQCVYVPSEDDTPCDDGDASTANDRCINGMCVGEDCECSGVNECCDGCHAIHELQECDDDNECTTGNVCSEGRCIDLGFSLNCDDGDPCTDDLCQPSNGCVHYNNSATCDDENACTRLDICQDGDCIGTDPVVCTALDVCHLAGGCSPSTGICSNPNAPDGRACDDGDPETENDFCYHGMCVPDSCSCGGVNDCCDGCSSRNEALACDDGNPCTGDGICQEGDCVGANAIVCNDNDVCTDDFCDPVQGCAFMPNWNECDDGNPCTSDDGCRDGLCQGTERVCSPPSQCREEGACSPESGSCLYEKKPDGTSCQWTEEEAGVCVNGSCSEIKGIVVQLTWDKGRSDEITQNVDLDLYLVRERDFGTMMTRGWTSDRIQPGTWPLWESKDCQNDVECYLEAPGWECVEQDSGDGLCTLENSSWISCGLCSSDYLSTCGEDGDCCDEDSGECGECMTYDEICESSDGYCSTVRRGDGVDEVTQMCTLHPGEKLNDTCSYINSTPVWGEEDVMEDDPVMGIDDADGFGPEIISIKTPASGRYRIVVRYYSGPDFTEEDPLTATVKVLLNGQEVNTEVTARLNEPGLYWKAADIVWDAATSPGEGELVVISKRQQGEALEDSPYANPFASTVSVFDPKDCTAARSIWCDSAGGTIDADGHNCADVNSAQPTWCDSVCGNGMVERGEECEPSQFDICGVGGFCNRYCECEMAEYGDGICIDLGSSLSCNQPCTPAPNTCDDPENFYCNGLAGTDSNDALVLYGGICVFIATTQTEWDEWISTLDPCDESTPCASDEECMNMDGNSYCLDQCSISGDVCPKSTYPGYEQYGAAQWPCEATYTAEDGTTLGFCDPWGDAPDCSTEGQRCNTGGEPLTQCGNGEVEEGEECELDSQCETGQQCVNCQCQTTQYVCTNDDDCTTGHHCGSVAGGSACVEDCENDGDCPEGASCNPNNGRCDFCVTTCTATQCCNWNVDFWYCGSCCEPPCPEGQACQGGACVNLQCPLECDECEFCGPETGYVCERDPDCTVDGDTDTESRDVQCLEAGDACGEPGMDGCCSGICLMGQCL